MSLKKTLVLKYFIDNPDATIDNCSEKLGIPRSTVQNVCANDVSTRKLHVVASRIEENLYFVFNGVTERKLITDNELFVLNAYNFSYYELKYIQKCGFKTNQ